MILKKGLACSQKRGKEENKGERSRECTVRTVAADLRQGEHIPKMQNDIGHKSKLRVLRQRGGKERGGALAAMPCRAVQ